MGFLRPRAPKVEVVEPPPTVEDVDPRQAGANARERARRRLGSEDTTQVAFQRTPGRLGQMLRETVGGG